MGKAVSNRDVFMVRSSTIIGVAESPRRSPPISMSLFYFRSPVSLMSSGTTSNLTQKERQSAVGLADQSISGHRSSFKDHIKRKGRNRLLRLEVEMNEKQNSILPIFPDRSSRALEFRAPPPIPPKRSKLEVGFQPRSTGACESHPFTGHRRWSGD